MRDSKAKILLLPGDGIGPEVNEALKQVVNIIDSYTNVNLDINEELIGGASYDKYKEIFGSTRS